jgi:ankyrin repeat protein
MLAVDAGNSDMAKLLLRNGANINTDTSYWGTALSIAASNDDENMTGFLIKSGADRNKQGKGGKTALMIAAMKGNIRIAEQLIQNGADANAEEKKTKYTPLDYSSGNDGMINFLKQNGASKANAAEYGKIMAEKFTGHAVQKVAAAEGSCSSPVKDSGMWMIAWKPKRLSDFAGYKVRIPENTKGSAEFFSREEGERWLNGIYAGNKMNLSFYGGPADIGTVVPVK